MDTQQGVSEVGDTIAEGWPVVTDYGATYGTTFPSHLRREIALARGEIEPLETVSLVTFKDNAYSWMNLKRIHPLLLKPIQEKKLDILEGISFIRYPCDDLGVRVVGRHYVNKSGEIQVFIVPPADPLMKYLRLNHDISYIAVRSSNISGRPEEPFAKGAVKYAASIAAPILAIRSLKSFYTQIEDEHLVKRRLFDKIKRKRYGSQPIIRLPSVDDEPLITLVRAGNTHPDVIKKLLKNILAVGIGFSYLPEKKIKFKRQMYHLDSQITDPRSIRRLLLKYSNLL